MKTFISFRWKALLIFIAIISFIFFLKHFPLPYIFIFLVLIPLYFFIFRNKEIALLACSVTFGLLIGEITSFAMEAKSTTASVPDVRSVPDGASQGKEGAQVLRNTAPKKACPDEERWESGPYMEKGYNYKNYDPVRGYSAFANTAVRRIEKRKCRVVSDVTYTLSYLGSRATKKCGSKKVALFFGCSFMYGEGINDADTMPYLTQEAAACGFDAINLAFHGYGPHQMLRMLETGFPDQMIAGRSVTYAFYRVAGFHAERVAGQVPWDPFGPKYVYKPGSGVVYAGTFSPTSEPFIILAQNQIKKSFLFNKVLTVFSPRVIADDEKIQLLAEVVAKSDHILKERYGVNLKVLYELDQSGSLSARDQAILGRLKEKGIEIILSRDVYRDTDRTRLVIWDNHHPSRLANQLWANHIKTIILNKK